MNRFVLHTIHVEQIGGSVWPVLRSLRHRDWRHVVEFTTARESVVV